MSDSPQARAWLRRLLEPAAIVLSALAVCSLFLPFGTATGTEEFVDSVSFSAIQSLTGGEFDDLTLEANIWVLFMILFPALLILCNLLKMLIKSPRFQGIFKPVLLAGPLLGLISVFFAENQIFAQVKLSEDYTFPTPLIANPANMGVGYLLFFLSFVALTVISLIELKYRPRGASEIAYWLFLILAVGYIIAGVLSFLNGAAV